MDDTENKETMQAKEDRPPPYRPEEIDLEEEARLQADSVGENFKRYKDQAVNCLPPNAVKPIENFTESIESQLLLKNVTDLKYNEMTPIQKWAIPAIKEGHDIIACAQTGSGKTAAFLLPILQDILKTDLQAHDPNDDCQNPYCLIVSPTRELARQIYTHAKMLAKDSLVKCCCIYGQVSIAHQKAQLSNGCHVLVATLGRLKDFLERRWIGFKNIKFIVLDEGDRLIDDGFKEDIANIYNHETISPKQTRQTLFFSATFKKDIQAKAVEFLRDSFIFLAVGKIGASNEDIRQEFLQVERTEKKRELKKLLAELAESDRAIIFTQTKSSADILAGFFTSMGLPAASIHGDRHQHQREQAITLFRRGDRRFLISSPVGNRGLDLPKVSLVINYDLPDNIDEYVHRIGRTGRAGHTGRAISFVDKDRDNEILPDLLTNLKDANQEIPTWLTDSASKSTDNQPGGFVEEDWGAPSSSTSDRVAPANNEKVTGQEDWGSSTSDWGAPANTSKNGKATGHDDWGSSNGSNKRPVDDEWGAPASTSNKKISSGNDDWASSHQNMKRPADDGWGSSANPRNNERVARNDNWGSPNKNIKRPVDDGWGSSANPRNNERVARNDDWGSSNKIIKRPVDDGWGSSANPRNNERVTGKGDSGSTDERNSKPNSGSEVSKTDNWGETTSSTINRPADVNDCLDEW